jgi:hypothetical protein
MHDGSRVLISLQALSKRIPGRGVSPAAGRTERQLQNEPAMISRQPSHRLALGQT